MAPKRSGRAVPMTPAPAEPPSTPTPVPPAAQTPYSDGPDTDFPAINVLPSGPGRPKTLGEQVDEDTYQENKKLLVELLKNKDAKGDVIRLGRLYTKQLAPKKASPKKSAGGFDLGTM